MNQGDVMESQCPATPFKQSQHWMHPVAKEVNIVLPLLEKKLELHTYWAYCLLLVYLQLQAKVVNIFFC